MASQLNPEIDAGTTVTPKPDNNGSCLTGKPAQLNPFDQCSRFAEDIFPVLFFPCHFMTNEKTGRFELHPQQEAKRMPGMA